MMRTAALASFAALATGAWVPVGPTIGIITQPHALPDGKEGEYIAASYIKFVEAAGARAVPIHYTADEATLQTLAKSVNGILLPGGSASLKNASTYYMAGKTLYNAAVKSTDAGQPLPIWGTCLGFEELAKLLSDSNDKTLSPHKGEARFDSENYPVPLVATEALAHSRMFGGASPSLIKAVTTENITMNNHGAGVAPSDFVEILGGTVEMLSTNLDRAGRPFVSSFEAKSYPFYGTQWHPEKNAFEWNPAESIPHSADAVSVMQHVANFFVSEARKNDHAFASVGAETEALIFNYATTFTNAGFTEEYIWPQSSGKW